MKSFQDNSFLQIFKNKYTISSEIWWIFMSYRREALKKIVSIFVVFWQISRFSPKNKAPQSKVKLPPRPEVLGISIQI